MQPEQLLAEVERRNNRLLLKQSALEEQLALRTSELIAANDALAEAHDEAQRIADINTRLTSESALILNTVADGIIGMDVGGHLTYLNPAAARITGRTRSDFEHRGIHELIHSRHPDGSPYAAEDCATVKAIRRGQAIDMEVDTFWRADGSSFPVEFSATTMRDERGRIFGAVLTFRDIGERRAIETMKDAFVSTVSHELRTPLTSIRAALGLLSSGLLGPIVEKGQRMLEIAITNSDRLLRLINDMLDLERIGSGKVELALGPVDAHTVMVQASEGLQSIADRAGVRLVIQPASASLWGDSDRIIQTLTNLIGNALKFSPPDTTVTVSGTSGEADFVFCVADQGRGVPEEKVATIFERFSQVDASDSRDKGGSGLGLAICQSIVTAHGGRIWVESNDPAGSRFRFTIPLAVPSTIAPPAIESPFKTDADLIHVLEAVANTEKAGQHAA